MASGTNGAVELIRVLNNSVLALGVKKVVSYLKWITKMNGNDRKDIADLVIYSVCEKYKLNPTLLLEAERNDGDRNDAVCLMAYLLKKHALMNQKQIAEKLNRHKSQVSKYISRMANLNTALFKADRKIYADYLEINESIESLIQKEQETWMQSEAEVGQEKALQ